ncbi:hypothetical protein VT84_09285 [Gemmata sp. SH-PL17]|nr:hypothetical protein [Gemmata sp. SH-PL17]AMV24576.1 hypothetical protein VT84_09285 [Gemmata sp. SH-PL17]
MPKDTDDAHDNDDVLDALLILLADGDEEAADVLADGLGEGKVEESVED